MEELWGLGARYCVRQNIHAFIWLWGLFLTLAGAAYAFRAPRARFPKVVLLFFAFCTGALGMGIFYGCSRWAPYSMGLGSPNISAGQLDTFMCLSQDSFARSLMWTLIVLTCIAAVALFGLARSIGRGAAFRALCALGGVLLLLVAVAGGFLVFFAFSWCMSRRLF